MAQVNMPQRTNDTNQLLTLGGGVTGALLGGPSGALMGASAGQTAGGLINSGQIPAQTVESSGQAEAMARRQQQLAQDNLNTLKQAQAALPQLPENVRQQYAPAIIKARMMEEQSRGMS